MFFCSLMLVFFPSAQSLCSLSFFFNATIILYIHFPRVWLLKTAAPFAHETHTGYTCLDNIHFLSANLIIHFGLMNMEDKEILNCLFHFGFIVNHTISLDTNFLEKYFPFELTKINPAIFANQPFYEGDHCFRSKLTANVLCE